MQIYKYRTNIIVGSPVYNLSSDLQLPAISSFLGFPRDNTARFRLVWASLSTAEKKRFRDIVNVAIRDELNRELGENVIAQSIINFSNLTLTLLSTLPPERMLGAVNTPIANPPLTVSTENYDGVLAHAWTPGYAIDSIMFWYSNYEEI